MAADQNMDPGVTGTFIHNVTLEGFKSFALKTAFDGLHPRLNYIAGPSETGKSSFLDAVCLVLGHNNSEGLEELIFLRGRTSVKKATVSLTLKHPDTVISLEISPDQRLPPVLKVDGEERTADYVKQLLHSMHFDASYSLLHISKDEIAHALLMLSFYPLNLLSRASGLGSQRLEIQSSILTYSVFANSVQCLINELDGEKERLEAWSAKNIELENLEKIYIGFEYRRLDFEISKARTECDSIKLDLQNLKSQKQRFVPETQREEHQKYATEQHRNHLVSSLKNEDDCLQIKRNQLGQKQEQVKEVQNECQILEKLEVFNQLRPFFVGESSSSAGPALKKTKLEDGNQQLINGLFTQLSTAIEERLKPMTESQDPEGDKQLLSTKKKFLETCLGEQSELEHEVIMRQMRVDKLNVDLEKVEAELAQQILEMKQRDHLSNMKRLDGQIEFLHSKVENSEANIQRLSLEIEKLLEDHSWLNEEMNNFQTVGNEAELEKAYEKAEEDFQVLQAEQNVIEPTLCKNVDNRLEEWHANLYKALYETIPNLERGLQEFDSVNAPKLEERRLVVNEYFGQILSFLLPGCVARLEKLDATASIFKGLRVTIDKTKEGGAVEFSDMVEEQKWLVMLSLYFALLRSTDSSICLLDMSDSLIDSDSNLKAKFEEMKKGVFQECQFIVTTVNREKVVDAKSFNVQAAQTVYVSYVSEEVPVL